MTPELQARLLDAMRLAPTWIEILLKEAAAEITRLTEDLGAMQVLADTAIKKLEGAGALAEAGWRVFEIMKPLYAVTAVQDLETAITAFKEGK